MSPATTPPVRLALVGAGGIAQAYAELLGDCSFAVAVGVADVDPAAAERWAAKVGCPWYTDPAALLTVAPEAVVICTPPATHAALAELFTSHGVAVLSEKPLSVDQPTAFAMLESAVRHDALLAMAAKFRFCTDIRRTAALIEGGELGDLRLIENTFTSRLDMRNRWNSRRPLSGGGVVIDNGTHSVDLLAWLCGPIVEVLATEQARPAGLEVEDTARLQLRTERGIDATVDLSWSIDKSLDDFLRVFGTEGEARVGWRSSAWRRYGGEWEPLGTGYSKLEAMGGALEQFCRAVRGLEAPAVGATEAVASAAVIDAAYRSLANGGWATVATAVPADQVTSSVE